MARVRLVSTVRGQGRLIVKPGTVAVAPLVVAEMREASRTQLRVMAEELRQLIVDRAFAGAPQPPGSRVVSAPSPTLRIDIPTAARTPLNLRPLTRRHARRKAAAGHDGRILIEAGDYLSSIAVIPGRGTKSVTYTVRPASRDHEGSGDSGPIKLSLLARVLEFGSRRWKIPARPHWRPAARDIQARFKRLPRDVAAAGLRAALRRVT